MCTIHVQLGLRSYDIVVTTDNVAGLGSFARGCVRGSLAVIVTDHNVAAHSQTMSTALKEAGFTTATVVLAPGEAQKSLTVAATVFDRLIELHADRQTAIVAVGGGVIGDLAGFVAATFARGLPLLMAPTTLLAMVDSSVGGKVGVNHPRAKNMIGAFHQPRGVWIDTAILATLPEREYRSGLAEVVKYGVILDKDFFADVENNASLILQRDPTTLRRVIARCCRLKADVVERDEREETGLRALLNLGHTFAHAFETAAGYGSWLHGEAVAAGIICASRLAEKRGLIPAEITVRQERLLVILGLPTRPEPWAVEQLIETMRSDKKARGGRLRFVLPRRLGEAATFDDIPEELVRQTLIELAVDEPRRETR